PERLGLPRPSCCVQRCREQRHRCATRRPTGTALAFPPEKQHKGARLQRPQRTTAPHGRIVQAVTCGTTVQAVTRRQYRARSTARAWREHGASTARARRLRSPSTTPVVHTQRGREVLAGGHGAGATPVPIPNTAVKPRSADGTARET